MSNVSAMRERSKIGIERKMIALMKDKKVESITPVKDYIDSIMNRKESPDDVKRRIDQFDAVMANVNIVFKAGVGINQRVITAAAQIPLDCLYVDMRYQGLRTHPRLNRLYTRWDVRKLGPITVVPHPEEHRFAVVDGQGRFIIANVEDMKTLSAIILMDAPDDPEERLKFEAEYFIGQGDGTEIVTPVQKHLARVIIGDETAISVEKILKKYKVEFVGTKGQRAESVLGSYKDAYSIVKNNGEKCLEYILSIIENAGWNQEENGYSTFVVEALRKNWISHPFDRNEMHVFLSNELRKLTPIQLGANAMAKYPMRSKNKKQCTLYIEDMVCEGLGIQKEIYIDEKTKIQG